MRRQLACLLGLFLLAPPPLAHAQAGVRIGFVDVSGVLRAVPAGKQAMAELKVLYAANQAEVDKAQVEVKRLQAEVKADGARLTAQEMVPRQAELQKRVLAFQALYTKLQKELSEEEGRRTLDIKRTIRVEAAALATRQGLAVVVDKTEVVWGHAALDFTAELAARLGGVAAVAPSSAAPPLAVIATVDPPRALQGCREGRAAKAELMSAWKEAQNQLDRAQKAVREDKAELDRVGASLGGPELAQRTQALQEKMMALQKLYLASQRDMNSREQKLTAPILKRVFDAVARLAPGAGYALVLNATAGVAHAGVDLDLTAAVIRALDGEEAAPAPVTPIEAVQLAVMHPDNLGSTKAPAADRAARVKAALQAVGATYRLVLAAPVFVAASVVDVTPEVARRADTVVLAVAASSASIAQAEPSAVATAAGSSPSTASAAPAPTASAVPEPTIVSPPAAAVPVAPALPDVQWPLLDEAPATGSGAKDTAVIAAVEQYLMVSPVPGARRNADAWYTWFTSGRGTAEGRVRLLRDRQVTRERLLKQAREAASEAVPGGTLWLIFIGHGAPAADGKDGVLVGADAQQDADSLYARSVARTELLEVLAKSRADRIVVVLDTCFSGQTPTGQPVVAGLQPLVLSRAASVADARMTVLTAAKSDQFAGPLPGAGRPAFSYLVLGGLRGWADKNGDGQVTAAELVAYSENALRALVTGRSQTPTLTGSGEAVLSAAREPGPDLRRLVLRFAGQ